MVDVLPLELWVRILGHVDQFSRIALMQTCKWMRDTALMHAWPPWGWDGKGLIRACSRGHAEYYLRWEAEAGDRWHPSQNNDEAIRWATIFGETEIVKILLRDERLKFDDQFNFFNCVSDAAFLGHFDIVQLLVSDFRREKCIQGHTSRIFDSAVRTENTEMMRWLLSKLPFADYDIEVLIIRSLLSTHSEMVKAILEHEKVLDIIDLDRIEVPVVMMRYEHREILNKCRKIQTDRRLARKRPREDDEQPPPDYQ